MRVVALFRVSTERQANEGASLDAQERAYRALAVRNGWTTVAEFRGCESATMAASERHVLQQVLACVRETQPDAVYVHEQSRLTRGDELEVALLMRELRERRLKIVVHGVVRDLNSIDERFMVGIQSLVDRAESERIKERMNRGKREKARKGLRVGGAAPYGYENPPPGTPGRGTLRVVPDEAPVVRRIFDLAAKGRGEKSIAKAITELGVPAPRGGRVWGGTTVRRLLKCPAYLGTAATNVWVPDSTKPRTFRLDMANEKAIVFENAHVPIVTREEWDAVHQRAKPPRTAYPRMLCGVGWCNGKPLHGETSRGLAYYRGPRGQRGTPWLDTAAVDEFVWKAFASLATSPEFVARLMREAATPRDRRVVADEIEHIEGQLERHRRRLATLVDLLADGDIDKPTYRSKGEESKAAVERLEAELRAQKSKATAFDGTHAARVAKAVQALLAGRTKLTADQRRGIMRSIVRRVDLSAEPTGSRQRRGSGGAFAATGGPRWAITNVAFQLALPPEDAADGAVGRHGGNGAGLEPVNGASRDRVLRTTPCPTAQETVTEGGDGAGVLRTTA